MGNFVDLVGKKFGRLTVVKKSETKRHNRILWVCLCGCGNVKEIPTDRLNSGNTTSCGCYAKEVARERIDRYNNSGLNCVSRERKTPPSQAALNSLFGRYKRKANERSIGFLLTKEDFTNLILSNCYYCGLEPKQLKSGTKKRKRKNGLFSVYNYGDLNYNGIDRVNNSVGYELENCVPCCYKCNTTKNDIPFWLVKRITEHPLYSNWLNDLMRS